MKDLTELTDFRKSPLTLKANELKEEMLRQLQEENAAIDSFLAELHTDMERTSANMIHMERAVSLSGRPGSIKYRQTAPEIRETERVRALSDSVRKYERDIESLRSEACGVEASERRRLENKPQVSSQSAWIETYGKPKRLVRKEERLLSIPNPVISHIPGANSKDGKVNFEYQPSAACSLRKGKLTD